jgi:hypothetical protein
MRTPGSSFVLFAALFAAACQSTSTCCADCTKAQTVVAAVAQQNADCTRLSLHCTMAEGGAKYCASTDAARVGRPSDAEDIRAIQTGQPVVLDEAAAIDVTIPIFGKDGKYMAACGVTLQGSGMTKEQAITKATTIAKAVEAGLGGSCACCCK